MKEIILCFVPGSLCFDLSSKYEAQSSQFAFSIYGFTS